MKKLWLTFLLSFGFYTISDATLLGALSDKLVIKPLSIQEELLDLFLAYGVDSTMSKILVAQASHESGNFKNKLTREHKNVFSILHSNRRETLSIGPLGYAEKRLGYCSYYSIDSSAVDMLLYMKYRSIPTDFTSITKYAKFLKSKRYYEADEKLYTIALQRHYELLWLNNN